MSRKKTGGVFSMVGMLLVLGVMAGCDIAATNPTSTPTITPAPTPTPAPAAAISMFGQFCQAYFDERWADCKTYGNLSTKNTISLVDNIIKGFTPMELTVYRSQCPKTFHVESAVMMGSLTDQAVGTVTTDGTKKIVTVHLVYNGGVWLVDISNPLW